MRFLILSALLLTSAAWGKDEVRAFSYHGQQGTVTVTRVATDPERAIDLVIVADGYSDSKKERKRFKRDAKSIQRLFKEVEPFRAYRDLFTVHVVFLPVADDDATRFEVEIPHPEPRNLMTFSLEKVDALLASVGLEQAEVVHVVYDVDRFGGTAHSGAGVSISSRNRSELNEILNMGLLWTVAHELGHSVAGLVEERPSKGLGPERQCLAEAGALPNAFALRPGQTAPSAEQAPWAAWLPEEPEVVPHDDDFPYSRTFHPDKRPVGFFAGAASLPGGFRAQEHCLMRSDAHRFCVACRQALVRAFHTLSTPLRLAASTTATSVELQAISGLPEDERRVRWEAPARGPEVEALLAAANHEQSLRVSLPAGTSGVRCTLTDTTPWVRGGSPTAVATWPPSAGGAVGALGGAPTSKPHGRLPTEPHACSVPTEVPQQPEASASGSGPQDQALGD